MKLAGMGGRLRRGGIWNRNRRCLSKITKFCEHAEKMGAWRHKILGDGPLEGSIVWNLVVGSEVNWTPHNWSAKLSDPRERTRASKRARAMMIR